MFNSLKIKFTIIVFIVMTVTVGIYLLIITNVNSKLYRDEVQRETIATVKLHVSEIDRYTDLLRRKASDIGHLGEVSYKIKNFYSEEQVNSMIQDFLADDFTEFDVAIGGGLWYEPYIFDPQQKYYGLYAYANPSGFISYTWNLSTPEYDYLNRDWYEALPVLHQSKTNHPLEEFFFSKPHFDTARSSESMITVSTHMHSENGEIIGIATADSSINDIRALLNGSKITPDSEILLLDTSSQYILENTFDAQSIMKNVETIPWLTQLVNPEKDIIKQVSFTHNGVIYNAYYALTNVGMLYAVFIPATLLSKSTDQMNVVTIMYSTFLGLILLFLLYFILARITNPIKELTEAIERVAVDKSNSHLTTTSNDEIGRLINGFNRMIDQLALQKNKIEIHTTQLETKVKDRTLEIKEKNEGLEAKLVELGRLNKIMINRELKMIDLKEQIKHLEEKINNLESDSVPKM